jgi:hypothetical protein
MAFAYVLVLQSLISSGVIGSSSYNNIKGVNFVTLQMKVLWLHTVLSNSSAHLPFGWSSNIFLLLRKSMCLLFLLHHWTEDDTLRQKLLWPLFDGRNPWKCDSNCLALSTVLSGNSEAIDYVLPEKSFEPHCCDIDYRIHLYPLGEIFNRHYYILVVSLCSF